MRLPLNLAVQTGRKFLVSEVRGRHLRLYKKFFRAKDHNVTRQILGEDVHLITTDIEQNLEFIREKYPILIDESLHPII